MLKKGAEEREQYELICIDDLIPEDHILRKIEVNESITDPDSGVFHKGEHKKCFAYTAQTACDKNGYVMDVTVNPGNTHDSTAFDELYERMTKQHPEIANVVMDAALTA